MANRINYMHIDIDSFMRGSSYPNGYECFFDQKGYPLEPAAVLAHLQIAKARGWKVLPLGNQCASPCGHSDKGCKGFDPRGSGCPGYVEPSKESA